MSSHDHRQPPRVRLLFVCMGNICRSPAAESVMNHLLQQQNLTHLVHVDSAGTLGYHAGEPSDHRMRKAGTARGYVFDHLARRVCRQDFHEFDYILAMDEDNLSNLQSMEPASGGRARVSLLLDFHPSPDRREVPDPYYGGPDGFELVLDLVEEGCAGLLAEIRENHGLP